MAYLEKLKQDQSVVFLVFSECLCSTIWFNSRSLKFANLLADLDVGSPNKLKSKFGSSTSSRREEALDVSMI